LFRYDNLFGQADFSNAKRAREAFRKMRTFNFEAVLFGVRCRNSKF